MLNVVKTKRALIRRLNYRKEKVWHADRMPT